MESSNDLTLQLVTDKSVGQLLSAKTPLLFGLRQKRMIPFFYPWKIVIFFGKELVNWSSISGDMIGLSWEIKFGKINYLFGYYVNLKGQNTNLEFSKSDFSTSSYHNSIITGPIDMFFTKKYNYFSWGTRWNHPFLSQSL